LFLIFIDIIVIDVDFDDVFVIHIVIVIAYDSFVVVGIAVVDIICFVLFLLMLMLLLICCCCHFLQRNKNSIKKQRKIYLTFLHKTQTQSFPIYCQFFYSSNLNRFFGFKSEFKKMFSFL
jgi:hypothetical protein